MSGWLDGWLAWLQPYAWPPGTCFLDVVLRCAAGLIHHGRHDVLDALKFFALVVDVDEIRTRLLDPLLELPGLGGSASWGNVSSIFSVSEYGRRYQRKLECATNHTE